MSRVVVIEKNKDGKIELTKEELQKMLDDAYTQGYADGKVRYDTITYPSYPWYTTTTTTTNADKLTLNGTTVSC
jgi:hypothetical protein